MAVEKDSLEKTLKEAFPDAMIEVVDLVGDGDHYRVTIRSEVFQGLSKIRQHQKVYACLNGIVGESLHALSLITSATR